MINDKFESPVEARDKSEKDKSRKILKKRGQVILIFTLGFIFIIITGYKNLRFTEEMLNIVFWLISFNIALMLILSITEMGNRISQQESKKIKFFTELREESFEKEIKFLKEQKLKEAQKEFNNQSDIYQLLSVIKNKFILNITLSIVLSILYFMFYFMFTNMELINQLITIPYIGQTYYVNLILLIVFFGTLWFFIKSVLYIAYVFADS